jgi:hypothetical protein
MRPVPILECPLQPIEQEWILKLANADFSITRIAKIVRRSPHSVRTLLVASGFPVAFERRFSAMDKELERLASRECEEARAEATKPSPAPEATDDGPARATWRMMASRSNGQAVPITLARVPSIQTPIEQGRAFLWSCGGRGREGRAS